MSARLQKCKYCFAFAIRLAPPTAATTFWLYAMSPRTKDKKKKKIDEKRHTDKKRTPRLVWCQSAWYKNIMTMKWERRKSKCRFVSVRCMWESIPSRAIRRKGRTQFLFLFFIFGKIECMPAYVIYLVFLVLGVWRMPFLEDNISSAMAGRRTVGGLMADAHFSISYRRLMTMAIMMNNGWNSRWK